eukprot:12800581-Alexandrium_andersonii.AAC.1
MPTRHQPAIGPRGRLASARTMPAWAPATLLASAAARCAALFMALGSTPQATERSLAANRC